MKRLILVILLVSLNIYSWKVKSHVAKGREIIKEIMKSEGAKVNLISPETGSITEIPIDSTIFNCIKENPEYFMAGNLGPDGFPDIFTGQMATHIENIESVTDIVNGNKVINLEKLKQNTCPFPDGSEENEECRISIREILGLPQNFNFNEEISDDNSVENFDNTKIRNLSNIPYKYRKSSFWRSIDWSHFLIDEATKPLYFVEMGSSEVKKSSHVVWKEIERLKNKNEIITDADMDIKAKKLRCQAISFSYGYINHMASDGFGHQYINILAGAPWDFADGVKEEVRHLAVEGYIDNLLRPWLFQHNENVYSNSCIGDIFSPILNTPNCVIQNKFSPALNLPLYDLKLPQAFLMDTLMSKTVVSAAPLSYHIKLFRELQEIINKMEIKMAYGEPCKTDSDCNEINKYHECLDTGYCKKSYSSAYDAVDNECSRPSMSAYLFNECFRLGAIYGEGAEQFKGCINDFKDFAVLTYLKGVDKKIDDGMKKWIDTSADLMGHGMMEDPESNDFKIEDKECKQMTDDKYPDYLCVDDQDPVESCLRVECGVLTREARCGSDSAESIINMCQNSDDEFECGELHTRICEENTVDGQVLGSKECFNDKLVKEICKTDSEISQDDKIACINEFRYICEDCHELNHKLCFDEAVNNNHYACINRPKFDKTNEYKYYCTPKTPNLPLKTAISSYIDILNDILKMDQNSPLAQMISFSCNDIQRYNYIEICESVKKELQGNIDELIDAVRARLKEKMLIYLEPIVRFTAKLELLYQKYNNPESLLGFAYCTEESKLKECFDSCKANITNNIANGSLSVSDITCNKSLCENNITVNCAKSTKIRNIVLTDMGLLERVEHTNVIDINTTIPKLLFYDELNANQEIENCIQNNNINEQSCDEKRRICNDHPDTDGCDSIIYCDDSKIVGYHPNNVLYACWFKELLKSGKRYSFMSETEQENNDFWKKSPFKNFPVLFNSLQLNKLSLITNDYMNEVYSHFGTTHKECLKENNAGSFVYEAIASLDGRPDFVGDEITVEQNNDEYNKFKFYELKKAPVFCLLNEGNNDVFNSLFMKKEDSNSAVHQTLPGDLKPSGDLDKKELKMYEHEPFIIKKRMPVIINP